MSKYDNAVFSKIIYDITVDDDFSPEKKVEKIARYAKFMMDETSISPVEAEKTNSENLK